MVSFLKRLWRGWEITDSFTALLTVLGWKATIVSLAASALFGYWAWSANLGHLPTALIALHVFIVMLWGLIGLSWWQTRDRPSKTRQTFDYSYGLHLAGIDIVRGKESASHLVDTIIWLHNATDYPMKVYVDDMLVILGTTTAPHPQWITKETVISSRCSIYFSFPALDISSMPPHVKGSLRYSVRYGHPSGDYVRNQYKAFFLNVHLDDKPTVGHRLLEERDEPLS